ncbi:membrane-bound lytic murein transglycosylase B [Elusimicrobium simillimum]|uniref:hypothetical protein n=1 Tax=Elusimicrobium simillimum TaxID=3143438 RepID=UPI003C6EDA9E
MSDKRKTLKAENNKDGLNPAEEGEQTVVGSISNFLLKDGWKIMTFWGTPKTVKEEENK